MSKIIWIDVGTHFAQEHKFIFGSNTYFYRFLLKRFIGGKILKRGKFVKFSELKNIINYRKEIRKRSNKFFSIFIEANPKIALKENFYPKADMFFNLALTDKNYPSASIAKLFVGNGGDYSEGNTLFKKKFNSQPLKYIPTLGVSVDTFFKSLEAYLSEKFNNYRLILRLNCEGVEDEVIYSVHEIFDKKLILIAGSLKDVEEIKGESAFNKLLSYMKSNQLKFIKFSSGIDTWQEASKSICKVLMEDI